MKIALIALLAGPGLAGDIDRASLDLGARAEALRPATAAVVRRAGAVQLDLGTLATICRAAGHQKDPESFLATLGRAYALPAAEQRSLRASCAAYLAGQADARRMAGPTY